MESKTLLLDLVQQRKDGRITQEEPTETWTCTYAICHDKIHHEQLLAS